MIQFTGYLLSHPRVLDDPRTALTIYLSAIATTICGYLIIWRPRLLRHALVVAALSAVAILAPLRQWLFAPAGASYPLNELREVLFAAALPFLLIFLLGYFSRRKLNSSVNRGASPDPS